MKKFDKLVKETQVACDAIAPGQVRVGVMFDDEANRHFITGESELRMTISYDYDPNLIIPAKKRLHKCQDVHTEVIDNGNPTEAAAMFLSYYYQRQAHMMATDEEVLAFRGHPTQFQAA
tara:strand:- start:67 stop:423 length:357 start_codon:yes stop_codon:yes gene_type:complete